MKSKIIFFNTFLILIIIPIASCTFNFYNDKNIIKSKISATVFFDITQPDIKVSKAKVKKTTGTIGEENITRMESEMSSSKTISDKEIYQIKNLLNKNEFGVLFVEGEKSNDQEYFVHIEYSYEGSFTITSVTNIMLFLYTFGQFPGTGEFINKIQFSFYKNNKLVSIIPYYYREIHAWSIYLLPFFWVDTSNGAMLNGINGFIDSISPYLQPIPSPVTSISQ